MHKDASPSKDRISGRPDVVARYSDTLVDLYPNRPEGYCFKGFRAFRQQDYASAKRHFERAIHCDGREELLLHYYAQTLSVLKEDPKHVDRAVENWKWNFPYSGLNNPQNETVNVDSEEYKNGKKAFLEHRLADARKHFENDIKNGSQTEQLFYNYALVLIYLQEDPRGIAGAVRQWKRRYPYSRMPDPRVAYERAQKQQMQRTKKQ